MSRCLPIVTLLLTMICAAPVSRADTSPQIWFAAEPPVPLGSPHPTGGATDYVEWLTSTAGWERASHIISVVEINTSWIEKVATDDQLRKSMQVLASRSIKLALELNGLRATAECSGAGFANRDPTIPLRKILAAGGTVDYIVLNEPFAWASVGAGEHPCHLPPEKVATELRPFVDTLQRLAPNVQIGDAEPLWKNISGTQLVNWVDTFAAVTGTRFRFFHLDFDYQGRAADWVQAAGNIEAQMRRRQIAFGVFVFGNRSDASDRAWLETTRRRSEQVDSGVPRLDHIVIQSWHALPRRILPETNPDSFMAFVLRYAAAHGISPR